MARILSITSRAARAIRGNLAARGSAGPAPGDEIRSLIDSPISLLPEGLLDALTREQGRDLFAFLVAK